jgi:hypothetical protein
MNSSEHSESSELLILSDGRILAHNITPEVAVVLSQLDPGNVLMKKRSRQEKSATSDTKHEHPK